LEERVDKATLVRVARELLEAIGENPDREGLQETPRRFAEWWGEFIDYAPGETETCFTSTSIDQMICVSGMRVWSICEHHLLAASTRLSQWSLVAGATLGAAFAPRCSRKEQRNAYSFSG